MPQLINVVVNDRTTPTAVAHTFVPYGRKGDNVGILVENGSSPIANNVLTLSQYETAGGRRNAFVKLVLPVVANETINGITSPKLIRTAYVDLKLSFDKMSTEQERNNAVGMLMNALDPTKVAVHDTIVKLLGFI